MIQAITTFIKDNPALAALLAFAVLAIDSLYVYRTFKRARKKHPRRSSSSPSSKSTHPDGG